jgi:3'(2'), 5'-bisphosphate nucleotidase
VALKSDTSPITEADKRAHLLIVEALAVTGIPILSEEGHIPAYEDRKKWRQFWLIDPLDGTKEFVNRNGEFTVNIALIEDGKATMGVIYIPVTKQLYFADNNAYKIDHFVAPILATSALLKHAVELPLPQTRNSYVILGSRSHMNQQTEDFIKAQTALRSNVHLVRKGSSLKFCTIAEGNADVYPRFSPTMEWDTAAGHAILNAAGAEIINCENDQPLRYNKESLFNPSFIVQKISNK